MKEKIRRYINDCIEHDILFEMFGNELYEQSREDYIDMCDTISEYFLSFDSFASKSSTNKFLSFTYLQIEDFIKDLRTRLTDTSVEIAEKESGFIKKELLAVFGITLFIPEKITKVIPLAPYSESNSIETYLTSLENKVKSVYKNAVMSSYVMGAAKEDVSRTVNISVETIRKNLETETKNIATGLQRQTRNYVFLKNRNKMTYIWNSILDSRTCLVCGELHGKRFSNITDVPMLPPVHLNCRCSLIGVPAGVEVEIPSYSQWLGEQDDETQLRILGKARYTLYKNGTDVTHFVNNGKTLTLKEIYGK